jgi:hypothetical protein
MDLVVGFCEDIFMKSGTFVDGFSDFHRLKDCAMWDSVKQQQGAQNFRSGDVWGCECFVSRPRYFLGTFGRRTVNCKENVFRTSKVEVVCAGLRITSRQE